MTRWDVAGPEPLLEASFEGHADWVNDLALIGDLLITCSNDQTVRLWKAGSDNGQHLHTLSYHSDYVTRLAAAPARSLVVSAGLRAEIFLLNIEASWGTGKHTQLYPRIPQPSTLSSPGGVAVGAAVHAHVTVPSGGADDGGGGGGSFPSAGGCGGLPSVSSSSVSSNHLPKEQPGSVYALALNPTGTVVAAGTSEALVRLLDPRSGKKIAKLRGHQDTVRALLLNGDGTTLLSGASDGTIKLWDVGMQRCVQTYTLHSDAVWSLLSPDDSFAVVYSAGRDRALYRTYTHTRTSELLAVEDHPVRALALDPDVGPEVPGRNGVPSPGGVGLWAATSASHVNLWVLPREMAPGSAGGAEGGGRAFSVARRSLGVTANMRNRMSWEHNRQPIARMPEAVIEGVPGLVAHEVLADRRRVLTLDMAGDVALWDVLRGAQIASYGKVDFASKARELWEPRSVPSWFTADTRLGCLTVSLEPPSAFAAEEYAVCLLAQDAAQGVLGQGGGCGGGPHGALHATVNVSDDYKLNYGKVVLDCAFAKWRYKLAEQAAGHHNGILTAAGPGAGPGVVAGAGLTQGPGPGLAPPPPQVPLASLGLPSPGPGLGGQMLPGVAGGMAAAAAVASAGGSPGAGGGGGGGGAAAVPEGVGGHPYYLDVWAKYWTCRALPAVICSRQDGQRWRRLLSGFDGSEAEPGEVPTWVGDVVLRGAGVTPKEAKCAFVLLPAEGSDLPALAQSKLNAPRILQVHKVANYCAGKLLDQNVPLEVRPFYLRRPPTAPDCPGPESSAPGGNCAVLELTCNGVAVPFEMSLATVKKFIWKKSDDLVFNYRVRNPLHPAPPPVLQGPGA
ncbi:hypothetical protein PLESTF_000456600 [Pleodorina starrii]|nr:hypothetical protein PLESTF_000456600 [Pleodorina starrii]